MKKKYTHTKTTTHTFLPHFPSPRLDLISAVCHYRFYFHFFTLCNFGVADSICVYSCFGLLQGVHAEAGGSGASFVPHLPDPEDPHGPQTVPRLHAAGGPPPTALIPSQCYRCRVFTLQRSSRYPDKSIPLSGISCPCLARGWRASPSADSSVSQGFSALTASESLAGLDQTQVAGPHPLPSSF